jgi:polyphosphate kinase 2 (PPK2 family)
VAPRTCGTSGWRNSRRRARTRLATTTLFFLHISEEEQLRRRDDPLKTWKLTPADWENRRKRSQYLEAIEDMLARTDHDPSPWHLVEAESKKYARGKVVETVITHRARDARPADRAAGIRH